MRKMLCAIMFGVGALFLCVAPVLALEGGRMTGGGSVFGFDQTGNRIRVTHGFELHCPSSPESVPSIGPNSLEINWDGGNRFHLTTLSRVSCYSDLSSPAPPPGTAEMFDIYNGCGEGTYNGQPGYHACWIFTDHGEPGDNDTAEYYVEGGNPDLVVLNVPTTNLTFGNHQVHRENKKSPTQ